MIKVIHKKDNDKYKNVYYIGRGSHLGNPYTSIKGRETLAKFVVDSREESISLFKEYLIEKIETGDDSISKFINEILIKSLSEDVYLSCYCKPKSCHGDVIKEIIESMIEASQSKEGTQLNLFEDNQ